MGVPTPQCLKTQPSMSFASLRVEPVPHETRSEEESSEEWSENSRLSRLMRSVFFFPSFFLSTSTRLSGKEVASRFATAKSG